VFHTDAVAVWAQTFLSPRISFDRVDSWSAPFWRVLARISEGYDATVVSGGWLAERLSRRGVQRPTVVPFGIDKAQFSPSRRDPEVRARLLRLCNAPADAKLLVIASRLDPEKRIGTLLDAFRKASRTRPLALVIYGRGSLAGLVRRKAARMRHVHVAGYVEGRDELATALASADAFLHGSAAETYGLGVAEAICSGLPVIVPDRGGAAALGRGPWAARYRAGDVPDCAAAIGMLVGRDLHAARDACIGAMAGIETLEGHFERLFGLYGSLVDGPSRR
jgi:alpha-1,6-mannosyltransferase